MGIDPVVFGKYFWGTMHLTALGAPDAFDATRSNMYKTFFAQFANVLPCESCKEHLAQTYQTIPIDDALSGSRTLFAWTVAVHNAVNTRLGKPVMTVEAATKIWLPSDFHQDRSLKNKACTDQVLTVALVTASLAMIAVIAYMYSPSKTR